MLRWQTGVSVARSLVRRKLMRSTTRLGCGLVAAAAVAACSSPAPKGDQASGPASVGVTASKVSTPAAAEATLTVVKWPELESAVAAHRGKVVVMDVWADY